MSVLDMSSSAGSSGVHTSWNHGPSDIQHVPQCTELERIPLVSAEAPRQNASEMGTQFSMSLPDHGVSYCPQVTFTPSQMIYAQRLAPSQPGMMIFKGPQAMPLGELSIPGMATAFGGNLRMPHNGPPVSPSGGIPVMSHIRMRAMPYSGLPTVTSNGDPLTPKMLLDPTVPSTEAQAMLPSLAQMLPPRTPHNFEMPPAGSPLLLALESQGCFVSQPVSQEDPFLPKQPLPAPRRAEQYSGAQERAPRRPPVSRPYCCDYENCGKAYTKRSHLVSHQRKHTGERPYKCMWEACTWSFFRSDELGRHTRIHTKYRPHKCDQCGRQFMRSDHLRQHQRTHVRVPASPDPPADNGQMAGPPPAPGL
ncbi:Krueppel-like factor 17 [Hippopotamus amphibius kiboko]|uniref:Krueppel-like factor 17 n=1 Tax=Hippopotamus amphibius kiboko TaxID=575201 RepID=UPI002595F51A|nr:Krueppel-like factor 17 [Hippopotamus amphibius kiboko]